MGRRLGGCSSPDAERAWRAWRADERAVVVFVDEAAATGALLSSGASDVCVFRPGRVPPPAGPPPPPRAHERRACVLSVASAAVDGCGGTVLVLDPALAALRKASPAACAAMAAGPCAVACAWWPGPALLPALRAFFEGRAVVALRPDHELPRPRVVRLRMGDWPATQLMRGVAARSDDPAAALASVRRLAARPAEAVAEAATHGDVLLVTDGTRRVGGSCGAAASVSLESLLEHGPPDGLGPGPWSVVLLVQPLVEYTERLVAHRLAAAGVRVARMAAHTWTRDGDEARVDGWAAGPCAEAARRALAAALVV